jgi:hypothetical protein
MLYSYTILCNIFNTSFLEFHCTNFSLVCCYSCMQGCSFSIREDLLNKHAEEMVNYCTTASNNCAQDALASTIYLLNELNIHFYLKRKSQTIILV